MLSNAVMIKVYKLVYGLVANHLCSNTDNSSFYICTIAYPLKSQIVAIREFFCQPPQHPGGLWGWRLYRICSEMVGMLVLLKKLKPS